MAKFRFKLQAVLNIKEQTEDNLKNELGKALRKLEKEKEILKGIENERDKYIERFNVQSGKGIVVEKLKEYTIYISHLRNRMERQKDNINLAHKNVDNYREQLVKVVQERKILEKLKEKKYQEFLKEQLMEEQKLADEMVSYKYFNRLVEEKNG
jgi:flagellar FliJ protein